MKLDDAEVELGTWDAVRVAPTVIRGMQGGPEGAEILAFGAPTDEPADVEVVREFWPQ
jgi:hypothetical protein